MRSGEGRPPAADDDRPARLRKNDDDNIKVAEPNSKPAPARGCSVIGNADTGEDDRTKRVAELIYALSKDKQSGELSVIRAVAAANGIKSEDTIQQIAKGESDLKLGAPHQVRELLHAMDLAHFLAPVNLLFGKSQGSIFVADQQAWDDIEFEVALDSGSVVHVAAEGDTPCYILDDSTKARPCEEFIVGDGGTMKNCGQKTLNLQSDQAQFSSVFQIAAVTRPRMSVGRICDHDNEVTFDKFKAVVRDPNGAEICVFTRQPGGLYTAKLKVKSPFSRPE